MKVNRFFDIRANFFEKYTIFKKNSVKKMGKSIFPNLMSLALFGYTVRLNLYLCTALWLSEMRLGRSKLMVRMGQAFKKMVESYENSIKNNG